MAAVAEQEKELLSSVVDDTSSYSGSDPLHHGCGTAPPPIAPSLPFHVTPSPEISSLCFCASVTDRPMTPTSSSTVVNGRSMSVDFLEGLPLSTRIHHLLISRRQWKVRVRRFYGRFVALYADPPPPPPSNRRYVSAVRYEVLGTQPEPGTDAHRVVAVLRTR
jgi:hypothetical protein